MAQHTNKNDNRSNQHFGGNCQNFFQSSVNIARAVSNTDTQGSNDYHAQRREAGIVAYHFTEQDNEIFAAQHIVDNDFLACSRMDVTKVHCRENCGSNAADYKSTDEKNGDIGNFVAHALDKGKDTASLFFFCSGFHVNKSSFQIEKYPVIIALLED